MSAGVAPDPTEPAPDSADVDRRLRRLAVAALGSLAAEPVYVLVDTAIVGRALGTAQLGGLAVAATVLGFVAAAANFLTYGTTERVARLLGARRSVTAAETGVQALWLSIMTGLAALGLLLVGAGALAALLGADGETADAAVTYLRISALGLPFVVLALAAQGVQRGASDYRTPLVILVVSNLINVALEVLFVVVWDLGMAGSAWSTVIAQGIAAAAFAVSLRRHLVPAVARWPAWSGPTGMRHLMTAGAHLLLRVVAMLVVLATATAVAARLDAPTLAAHQIAMSLLTFIALSLDSVAIPAQTLVAEAFGRHDERADRTESPGPPPSAAEMRHVSRRVVRLSVLVGAAIAVVLAVLAWWLPGWFSGDPAVVERARAALWWVAGVLPIAAVAYALDGVLIGAADYRFIGRVSVAYAVVVVPLELLVLRVRGLGIAGVWAGLCVWLVLRAVVNHRRADALLAPGEVSWS